MSIDLNADVGEGFDAADAAIVPLITSANIACGGHAGDIATMQRTVALAMRHGVAVGAHPGLPDREGFGRRDLEISPADLRASLVEQIRSLVRVASDAGVVVRHVKPHGALYKQAAVDPVTAGLISDVLMTELPDAVLVGLADSVALEAGRAVGLRVAAEAFADRAYAPDGRLRPRSESGAVFDDADKVAAQAVSIARDGRVQLDDGSVLELAAQTLCLHGDEPRAIHNVRAAREALDAAGIAIAPLETR